MRTAGRTSARLAAVALASCLAVTACGGGGPASASGLRLRPCTVQERTARCGTLAVPEGRMAGNGRTISLRIVVIPAYGRSREPDPVVDFSGGPGGSAVSDIPEVLPALFALNQSRDLVFIDQRGTGGSNGLSCPPPPQTLASPAQVRRSVNSCLENVRKRADLRFYTSAMAAEDVAQVLTALHYSRVNLYGGSYGATAAQVFQQMFPARVRTMTLLSGTLLSIPLYERFPLTSQQALDQVFAHCGKDFPCYGAFRDLAAEWQKLRASLARRPVELPAAMSPTRTSLRIDDYALTSAVHNLLLSADTAVYIPLLIHSLYAAKGQPADVAAVIRHMAAARLLPSTGGQSIIGYPIQCAEPWARFQPAQVIDPQSYYYQNALQDARWWRYVCVLIPAPGAAAQYGWQRRSAVPVLMINGTADPQDPPANMAGAGTIWPDSRLIIEPGQAHSIDPHAWQQCDAGIVQAFVEHANASSLDARCLTQVTLPSFPAHW
jgi:pimeloyl-ACP methyl ester carboxylesterase